MTHGDSPTEEEIKTRWMYSEFSALQRTDDNSVWVSRPVSEDQSDIILWEVPIRAEGDAQSKNIDIVVLHDVGYESLDELRLETVDAWDIEDPTNPQFAKAERFVRQVLSEVEEQPLEYSLYEAKVSLNYRALGQILCYSEFFEDNYSKVAEIVRRERGLIFYDWDEMIGRTAERHGIELYHVRIERIKRDEEPSRTPMDSDRDLPRPDQSVQTGRRQLGSGRPNPQREHDKIRELFPQPNMREEFIQLEIARRHNSEGPNEPGKFFEAFAEDVLGEHIILRREEFVQARQLPDATGFGK